MDVSMIGIALPADTTKPPSVITLGPEKTALLRPGGGMISLVDLLQPAATLCVFRDGARLPVNHRATLVVRAADPARRQQTVRGDAVLVGARKEDDYLPAPPDYTDVLLRWNGGFRIEFQHPAGGRRMGLSFPVWSEVFTAYREGLRLGRALPREAVRVVRAS